MNEVNPDPVNLSLPKINLGSALTIPIGILLYSICQTSQPKYSGFIYIGLLTLSVIIRNLMSTFNITDQKESCINEIFNKKKLTNDFFISFYTLVYTIVPMLYFKIQQPLVMIFLVSYTLITIITKRTCYNQLTILIDVFIATMTSLVSIFIVIQINPNCFLFMPTPSDAEQCSKPSNQKMVCAVHKNGELVKKF
uniref:Uncharacterized protein n=1 Tax=viral metagenome TaxID=1070528 RepID=A0A6C0HRY4_9ZZZZ